MHHPILCFTVSALLASAAFGQCFSVSFNGASNGQKGSMFEVRNISAVPINIGSLDQCFLAAGTDNIEIYTIAGSCAGLESNPAAWTLVGSATGFVHGVSPAFDPLPIPIGITIAPSAVQSFYVTVTSATAGNVYYTTGTAQYGVTYASNADLEVIGRVGATYPFGGTFGLPTAGRLWNGRVNYCPGAGGTVLATNTTTGAGCINVADVSSYENFATSAAFDLANTSISLLHTGVGYTAVGGIATYVPPSATAQVLALTDDSEATVTLSQPMPVGSAATTTTLVVCSNGFISAGAGNGVSFTPAPATFLNGTRTWWSLCWHDYNPAIVGSGQVKFEQIGTIAYVTWDGVWDFGGASAANANTMQAQFDVTTGTVHFVYQATSTLGNGRLVGFSDAGASADPGSMDISAALPATYTAAVFAVLPLNLAATSRPIIGTNWNLNVTNVPAAGVVGVDIFGLADPGINDLAFLGLPGCGLRASLDVLNAWLVAGNSHGYSFAVPNLPAIVNVHLYTTSAVFQPGVNPFGAITANGIDGRIGDF